MTQAELAEAVQGRRRAGADRHRPHRRGADRAGRRAAEADRQFRQRRRQYRRRGRALQRGITVTNTPGVLTEDTADMTMALILAVPRRLAEGAEGADRRTRTGPAGRRPGCWATASGASGSASSAWAASARRWRGARRAFGLQIHYHNRQPRRAGDRGRAGGDLLGKPRPDAGAHGHRLGQLPAHAGDLSSAVGAAAEADEAGRLHRQHRARRNHRRERAGAHARGGRDRRRRARRVRA